MGALCVARYVAMATPCLFFFNVQSVIGQNKQLTVSKPSKDFPLPLQLVCEVKHTPAH